MRRPLAVELRPKFAGARVLAAGRLPPVYDGGLLYSLPWKLNSDLELEPDWLVRCLFAGGFARLAELSFLGYETF